MEEIKKKTAVGRFLQGLGKNGGDILEAVGDINGSVT